VSDAPRCHGEGEVEVGTRRDEFGNWDTETYRCPGCPDCMPPCDGTGEAYGSACPGCSACLSRLMEAPPGG
jgi:hypothetical protein